MPAARPAARAAGDLIAVCVPWAADAHGGVAHPGDVRAQTARVLDLLEGALTDAGASLGDLLEVTSLHLESGEVAEVLDVAGRRLGETIPAWTPVPVVALERPGALVGLRAIAARGGASARRVTPDSVAWARRLPSAAGVRHGDLVWVAGQVGADADGLVMAPGDHAGQARTASNRIEDVLAALDTGPADVLLTASRHQDPRGIATVVAAGERAVRHPPGTRPWSAAGVPELPELGLLAQLRCVADAGPGAVEVAHDAGGTSAAAGKRGGTLVAAAARPQADADLRGDLDGQVASACAGLAAALAGLGADPREVIDLLVLVTGVHTVEAATRLVEEVPWAAAAVRCCVVVTGLESEPDLIGLEALAVRGAVA